MNDIRTVAESPTAIAPSQEHDARLRVEVAAARARGEQEARLRAERARIDAHLEREERRTRSRGPVMLAAALLLGIATTSAIAWQMEKRATVLRQDAAEDRAEHEQRVIEIDGRLATLAAERARAGQHELEIAAREAERERLVAEKAALERELAESAAALAAALEPGSAPRKRPRPPVGPDREPGTSSGRDPGDRIELGDDLDPLAGLPGHG